MTTSGTSLSDQQHAWATAAAAVLRASGRLPDDGPAGVDVVLEALTHRTVDGIAIPPLGGAVRAPHRSAPSPGGTAVRTAVMDRYAAAADDGRADGSTTRGWDVRVLLADTDAAATQRQLLADLQGGVTSVWLRMGDGATRPGELATALHGAHLDVAPVVLEHTALPDKPVTGEGLATQAAADSEALLALATAPATLHPDSSLGFDPIGALTRTTLSGQLADRPAQDNPAAEGRAALAHVGRFAALADRGGVRAFTVDGTAVHDAGAGDMQELAYTLAAGATYLRALVESGLDIDTACRLIEFRYAVTDHQAVAIAKLRAARLVWQRVCELAGASPGARRQRQHAVTSRPMMTRYDPYVNMLRGTVAAFAAGVGGADALTVLPFDTALGIPGEFGHRMARNVSALLMGESGVAEIADPAGGAYAIETLTDDIAEAAWCLFGEIDAAGGILAALTNDSLTARIAQTRDERDRRIATRAQPITGVSEFPNAAEGPSDVPSRRPAARPATLPWAEPFEALRDAPMAKSAVLVPIGPRARASARLQFARNVLAAGGISVVEQNPDASLASHLRDTGGATVVFAGADRDYREKLAEAARAARNSGAGAVFLAGRPPSDLPDGQIDGGIARGDDMLAFLHTVRAALGGSR